MGHGQGCGDGGLGRDLGRLGALGQQWGQQWAQELEGLRAQHRGGPGGWDQEGGRRGHRRPGGSSGGFGSGFGAPWAQGGHGGPPPWLSGIFGLGQPAREERRGPRVRRGDVRSAILDVLATAEKSGETLNGYQVIQQIEARSGGAWKPSPGSVYPTIQQLEDEGLVETVSDRGRRSLLLTQAGATYVAEHAEDLAAVWAPFEDPAEQREGEGQHPGGTDLKPEIGQVMSAVWQVVTTGTPRQRAAAVEILVDARRRLYSVLADSEGADPDDETDVPDRPGPDGDERPDAPLDEGTSS
ncbi:PadR family transcriptional regulator [Nocardioides sp. zg-DK7169]|uniref:PadR family transcriptional regulator n=1 Tax=Nocardioides sp. zg-DK7169 TaxID=2736600 RepID=UPI0015579944|nr:PadR family transcriptional regulator [Nocardioides sp. zg-DK7169]NPC97214.1 PadR family transcriptional regulator [Nocardioides sp. zg-DK7169]